MRVYNNLKDFLDMNPFLFLNLKSIKFYRNIDDCELDPYCAELILVGVFDENIKEIYVKFNNVVDIKIGNLNHMFGIDISISDISDWQREGVTYMVSEQENNTFSFCCSDFEALIEE